MSPLLLLLAVAGGCGGAATGWRPTTGVDGRRVSLVPLPRPLRFDPRLSADAAAQQVARQLRKAAQGCGDAWVKHSAGDTRVDANFGPGCSSKFYDNLQGAIIVAFARDPNGLVVNYSFDHVVFDADAIDGSGFGASADGALLVAWGKVAQWHDEKLNLPPTPAELNDGFWHWENAPPEYLAFTQGLELILGAALFVMGYF